MSERIDVREPTGPASPRQGWPLAPTAARAGLVAVLTLATVTTYQGLAYSEHWDEHIVFLAAKRQVESGVFLPGRYNYPSFVFYSPFLALAPELVSLIPVRPSQSKVKETLIPVIESGAFRLRLRGVLAALSLTTIVSAYLLATALRRRELEGLAAAALVGTSWELLYHLRWVAPDFPQIAFGTASMAALAWALRLADEGRDPRWLPTLGAVLAGFATGSKYPAGMLLVPVLATPFLLRRGPLWARLGGAVRLGFVFSLSYLFTTPATILAPYEFIQQLGANARVYATEGHGQYTIGPGLPHLSRTLEYLGLVLPSHEPIAAGFVSVLALVGLFSVLRERWTWGVWLAFVPLFDVWWVTQLRVMIVRNVLFMAPFMLVFAAWGLGTLVDRARPRRAVVAILVATMVLVAAVNARWAVTAATSIARRPTADELGALETWLAAHSAERFVASPQVAERLRSRKALPHNLLTAPRPVTTSSTGIARDQRAIWLQQEPDNFMWTVPVNRRGTYTLLPTGPFEANMDYYASWYSQDRILITSIGTATTAGIRWARTSSAAP